MRVRRMGIVGGCLSHQPGIPFSRLYHQVLSRKLEDAYGVKLRPVIDRSFDAPLDQRLAALADRQTDLVLVHVRSAVTMDSTRLYRRRRLGPADDLTEPPVGRRLGFGSRAGLHPDWMHEGNVAIGVLLGRHRRVSAGQVSEAIAATAVAARRAVFPMVMGPTAVVRGPADHLVCATLNRSLVDAARTHGFEFVDVLQGWDRAFSLPDGTHLTAEGHRHVADRLFATIGARVAADETDDGRAPDGARSDSSHQPAGSRTST
jgi:hypothetical protein